MSHNRNPPLEVMQQKKKKKSIWAINLYQTPRYYMSFGNICSVLSHNPSLLLSEMGSKEQNSVYLSLGTGRKIATEGMSLLCFELVDALKYHQASLFQSILLVSTRDVWGQYTESLYSACGLGFRPCLLTQPHLSSGWLALQTLWVLAKSTVPRPGLLALTSEPMFQGNWSRAVHCHLYKLQDCRVPRHTDHAGLSCQLCSAPSSPLSFASAPPCMRTMSQKRSKA